jgi:hypothetical protein
LSSWLRDGNEREALTSLRAAGDQERLEAECTPDLSLAYVLETITLCLTLEDG